MNPATSIQQQGVRVTVRGLRRSFDGHPVLKGLNFDVERGEVFVVMGPSGSGKSVLLKHIIGLETPDDRPASWTSTGWPWSFSPAPCSTR